MRLTVVADAFWRREAAGLLTRRSAVAYLQRCSLVQGVADLCYPYSSGLLRIIDRQRWERCIRALVFDLHASSYARYLELPAAFGFRFVDAMEARSQSCGLEIVACGGSEHHDDFDSADLRSNSLIASAEIHV